MISNDSDSDVPKKNNNIMKNEIYNNLKQIAKNERTVVIRKPNENMEKIKNNMSSAALDYNKPKHVTDFLEKNKNFKHSNNFSKNNQIFFNNIVSQILYNIFNQNILNVLEILSKGWWLLTILVNKKVNKEIIINKSILVKSYVIVYSID